MPCNHLSEFGFYGSINYMFSMFEKKIHIPNLKYKKKIKKYGI